MYQKEIFETRYKRQSWIATNRESKARHVENSRSQKRSPRNTKWTLRRMCQTPRKWKKKVQEIGSSMKLLTMRLFQAARGIVTTYPWLWIRYQTGIQRFNFSSKTKSRPCGRSIIWEKMFPRVFALCCNSGGSTFERESVASCLEEFVFLTCWQTIDRF